MFELKSLTLGISLIAAAALQACEDDMNKQAGEYTIEVNDQIEDTCGLAKTVENLIADPSYLSELKMSQDRKYRVVAPNTPITMDFRSDRQTIVVDDTKKVISLKCG